MSSFIWESLGSWELTVISLECSANMEGGLWLWEGGTGRHSMALHLKKNKHDKIIIKLEVIAGGWGGYNTGLDYNGFTQTATKCFIQCRTETKCTYSLSYFIQISP